jgi:hypothetical protein
MAVVMLVPFVVWDNYGSLGGMTSGAIGNNLTTIAIKTILLMLFLDSFFLDFQLT